MKHVVALAIAAQLVATVGCGGGDEPLPDVMEQINLLRGDDEDGRWAALKNLQWLGPQGAEAVEPLRGLLRATRDEDLHAEIAQTLSALGPAAAAAAPEVIPLLDAKQAWTRAAAAEALGGMGQAAIPAWAKLVALSRDRDRDVAEAATDAVRRLRRLKKK